MRNRTKTFLEFGSPLFPTGQNSEVHEILKINGGRPNQLSQEFIDLYGKGCSIHDIARMTGRSRAWVRARLRRHESASRPTIEESKITAWRKRTKTHAHPPFGYAYFQGQLVIEPREQEIFLLIERLANEGMNPSAIAGNLNTKGLKPRRAMKWNRNSVILILNRLNAGSSKPDRY